MNKSIFAIVAVCCLGVRLPAQNVFPVKIGGCSTERFCLDCGDPKAAFDQEDFDRIITALNTRYNLSGTKGRIGIQVLVDSTGMPCVLSHTDQQQNPITLDAVAQLNQCKWTPAMNHDKPESSSVNVIFTIADGRLTGGIQRIDIQATSDNMSNPGEHTVYNKKYKYRNRSLGSYEISVWQKGRSAMPHDMSQHNIVDKNDTVWYATYKGLIKFDGTNIVRFTESNSPIKASQYTSILTVDQENNKWLRTDSAIYKYDSRSWTKYTYTEIGGATRVYNIVPTADGEVLFCTDRGLNILKDGAWQLLDSMKIKELPSNSIFYAGRDKKHRLWIGTFKGSVMVDADGSVTAFNASSTPLKDVCITGVVEDEEGNVYFSLYAYGKKERDKPEEGLAVLTGDGNWKHFNDQNSGMPSDHINGLLYDRFEKVLWIGTNESGLVRYDLKDGWENYHNGNSKVPSSYIFDLSQNSKGDVFVSTFYGMMRIHKKN